MKHQFHEHFCQTFIKFSHKSNYIQLIESLSHLFTWLFCTLTQNILKYFHPQNIYFIIFHDFSKTHKFGLKNLHSLIRGNSRWCWNKCMKKRRREKNLMSTNLHSLKESAKNYKSSRWWILLCFIIWYAEIKFTDDTENGEIRSEDRRETRGCEFEVRQATLKWKISYSTMISISQITTNGDEHFNWLQIFILWIKTLKCIQDALRWEKKVQFFAQSSLPWSLSLNCCYWST